MTRALLCTVVSVAGTVLIWDSSAPAQGRDATPVLTAAREALGGDRNLTAVKTFLASGRMRQIRGDNMVPVEFEIACELPDKYVRRDEFPAQDIAPVVNGFRGEEMIGASKTTREEFARLSLGVFAAATAAFPLTFTYAAEAQAPEGKADVLAASGPANFAARFLVQQETHMPVMLIWQAPALPGRGGRGDAGAGRGTPPPPVEHRQYYADYRAVNGSVKWPFRIRHAVAGTTIEEMTFDRVTVNAKIDPKKFEALK